MNLPQKFIRPQHPVWLAMLTTCLLGVPLAGKSAVLNAPQSGSFTMNLDHNELAAYSGYFLSTVWQAEQVDYRNPLNTGEYYSSHINTMPVSGLNQSLRLNGIGEDPINQPSQRFVKATSANFSIDSESLQGVDAVIGPYGNRIAGAQIGISGVQGFYAPYWQTVCCGLGGGLVNGDFSVYYDSTRKTDGRSGWLLANNIYFTMAVYDFANLQLSYTDADNWRLSGDLWMSPENGSMLRGEILNDVGDFCLGSGSYAGCGQLTNVPVPAASVLFLSGLLGLLAGLGTRSNHHFQSFRNKV